MRLATLPRFALAVLPTPLQRARNLEQALGARSPRIYIKRDDLTGLGFGGNKARKLEYLVGDALANGATALISEGAVQSNHARSTAAAACVAGLRCTLVLNGDPDPDIAGNLLLDHLFGADVRITAERGGRQAAMAQAVAELCAAGETPYSIPTGGSVPVGAAAYVAMVAEILAQLASVGEAPRSLYFGSGSLGTQAGLVVGARAFSASFTINGIAVERPIDELVRACVALADETAKLLALDARFAAADILLDGEQVGQGYGIATEAGLAAIRLLARTEAIVLDPVYSGKAMAGLLADIAAEMYGPDDAVIFLHTGGGPSIFPFGAALLAHA